MLLQPDQYAATPAGELLRAAARGFIGLDHRFLRAILDRYEECLPELVAFGIEERDDPVPLTQDLLALFRFRPCPEVIPYLIELVRRHPWEVRDEIPETFSRIGRDAVEPLLKLYSELPPYDRSEVAFILASLGARDPRILDLLLERLGENPGEGAFFLDVYGDPAAIPHLQQVLASQADLPDAAVSLSYAIRKLNGPEPAVALEPYDIWSDYPEQAGPRFDLLAIPERLAFLESASVEHRKEALAHLGMEDRDDEEVRARIFDLALNDPDPSVRGRAWEALRGHTEDEKVQPAMLARLQDPQAPLEERCGALLGLCFTENPAVRQHTLEFYEKPEARAPALEAMWRTADLHFAPYFSRHLDDPDVNIRREAITGVGFLRMHSEAGRLERYFDDDEVRQEALFAYAMTAPGKVTALHARQVFAKIEDLANGLSPDEAELVKSALDQLLALHGRRPIFSLEEEESPEEDHLVEPAKNVGRNDPCPCGSGKKYKKCCGK